MFTTDPLVPLAGRAHMAADPRAHRRFRAARAALIDQARQLARAGQTIRCVLCNQMLDPAQPYRLASGKLNPWAPTAEHLTPLVNGGALLDPANLDLAHRRCQSAQGARIANARRARQPQPRPSSRTW